MPTPRFSVVIPTHNRPRLLEAAVQSVARQTLDDVEIIVVNDGSAEDYSGFVERWGVRVNYLVNPVAMGVSAARNLGVAASRADWVVFLDDDDLMAPGYLAVVAHQLDQRNFDFCWCEVKFVFPPHRPGEKPLSQLVRRPLSADPYQSVANILSLGASFGVAVRKTLVHAVAGFDANFAVGEDTDFFLKLLARGAEPAALEFTGILKNETHRDRLTAGGFAAYSRQRVYERLLERHRPFLRRHPKNFRDLIDWAYNVHLRNGDPVAALQMIRLSCAEGFIAAGLKALVMGIYWELVRAWRRVQMKEAVAGN